MFRTETNTTTTDRALLSVCDWQPGNGTRYDLMLVNLPPVRPGPQHAILTWVNAPRCGRSMVVPVGEEIDVFYISDKLDVNHADAIAIGRWLSTLVGWHVSGLETT